jgi:hypothetical protein
VGVYNLEEDVMARIIQCECGFVARGQTDTEVIDVIRDHMKPPHPALWTRSGVDLPG